MNLKYLVLPLVCFGLGGCNGTVEPGAASADDGQVVERTIVKMLADGTQDVKVETVSIAQQRREWAAREQRLHPGAGPAGGNVGSVQEELVSPDSGCAGSSMWIFDNANNTVGSPPFNHEICFYKSSTAFPACSDLHQYVRQCEIFKGKATCQDWATGNGNAIGSFWAGNDTGMFLDNNGGAAEGFGAFFKQNDAQSSMPSATWLCFPNN